MIIITTNWRGGFKSFCCFTVKLNLHPDLLYYEFVLFHPRIAQAAGLKPGLSAVHVHLQTAAALQDCEGPGGGEEPDTSDAVAIEFENNAVVEENNFTDLGTRKKMERQLRRSKYT